VDKKITRFQRHGLSFVCVCVCVCVCVQVYICENVCVWQLFDESCVTLGPLQLLCCRSVWFCSYVRRQRVIAI